MSNTNIVPSVLKANKILAFTLYISGTYKSNMRADGAEEHLSKTRQSPQTRNVFYFEGKIA